MAQQTRDDIRSALLGQPKEFRKETVTVNGKEVEVRQPNLKARREIIAMGRSENGFDFLQSALNGVIRMTFVPGTDQPVFDDTDLAELESQPPGSFVDELISAVTGLLNVDKKAAAKNSEETASGS